MPVCHLPTGQDLFRGQCRQVASAPAGAQEEFRTRARSPLSWTLWPALAAPPPATAALRPSLSHSSPLGLLFTVFLSSSLLSAPLSRSPPITVSVPLPLSRLRRPRIASSALGLPPDIWSPALQWGRGGAVTGRGEESPPVFSVHISVGGSWAFSKSWSPISSEPRP